MQGLVKTLLSLALAVSVAAPAAAARQAKHPQRSADTARAARTQRLIDLGIQRLDSKDFAGAIDSFERAASVDAESANAFYHLGSAHYHRAFSGTSAETADQDDARNAIDAFETALTIDPSLGTVGDPFLLYHGLAQCYEAQGRLRDALSAIKESSRLSQQNPMPYLYGARIRFKLQDFDKSAANLYYGVRRARRANKYTSLAKLVKTSPLFSGMLEAPKNKLIIDAYDAVEDGTLTEKEAQERIRGYEPYRDALSGLPSRSPSAIEDDPREDPELLKLIATADRAHKTQHYRDAIRLYQQALSADAEKGALKTTQKSLILERIGSSYRQMGLVDEAIRIFMLSVREMPHNTTAFYQLALSYSVNGELGNALTALNQALESAHSMDHLRKTILMARTDTELEPVRDLPRYQDIMRSHSGKLQARR